MTPLAYTCVEAAKLIPGMTVIQLNRMLLKGKRLQRIHGRDVPADEAKSALFGKKIGKRWFIPSTELRRVYGQNHD